MTYSKASFFRYMFALLVMATAVTFAQAQVSVLTSRYDNGRSGLNDNEPYLNPANVNQSTFAKLGAYNVDGYIVGQPLYVPNVSINGSLHNVVYVATQHDSLFALDADNLTGSPLWQVSFINPANNVTTVPISDQGCANVNGYTEMGIQGTPVIDSVSGTLYVDVKTKEIVGSSTNYVHRLHAIDITSGQEKFGGPIQIAGSIQTLHGSLAFDSAKGCQRPGLLLSNGTVYVAFGSNGCDNTHGWVFAYDAATLTQLGVFNTSPNQNRGSSVWQAGAGLASDSNGNVFFITANGTFDVNTGGADYGDSFLKLTPQNLALNDYFTPYDQGNMGGNDLDLGSGGAMLLSNLTGQYSSVLIGAGKTGTIYVVNPTDMGHYNSNNNDQIIQWMQNVVNEVDATPAYWNNEVYFAPDHAPAVAYSLTNGMLSSVPVAQTQAIIPVGGPIISANGNTNGIVWLVRNNGNTARQMSAFDATKMVEIYNTSQAGTRDNLGMTAHFVVPTVANGKVFVGTQTQLVVYGLMPVISSTSGGNQTGAAGSTLPLPISVQAVNPYTGSPLSGVTVNFSSNNGGSFGSPSVVTDSNGNASTTYTLPTKFTSSAITVTASSSGYASATFSEIVMAGAPASIKYSSGGSQTGTVGTTLSKSIVYTVADQYGNMIAGASVLFTDSPNHGVFSPDPAITTSTGKATVSYTLPTKAGYVTVVPSIGALNGSTIQERALAGAASSMGVVSGNNQTAGTNKPLPKPLTVKVTDQYGNPVAGVTVTFTDNGAGGTFSSTAVVTNGSGAASVTYTTPGQTGTVTIDASVSGLAPAVFTEIVN